MSSAATAAGTSIAVTVALLSIILWHKRKQSTSHHETMDIALKELGKNPYSVIYKVDLLLKDYPEYQHDHVFHDTLNHYNGVLCPYVSHDKHGGALQAVVRFGLQTRGHPNLVHGGITALTFDNLFGWCLFLEGKANVLTAYLNVNFKAPLPIASVAFVEVKVDSKEGRKLFVSGQILSLDRTVTYATCSSLFIIPKSDS